MKRVSRRKVLRAAGATGLALSGVGLASAHGGGHEDGGSEASSEVNRKLAELRQATEKYHDLEAAEADGYVLSDHCVSNPEGEGAMGFHAGNFGKVDGNADHTDPEVLVYEKQGDEYHLVATEFLVVAEEAPTMFDREMHLFIPADHPQNPFGQNVWALHAWVWKGNPNGTFADFNPNVSCPDSEE
jgi:hypothetical protein